MANNLDTILGSENNIQTSLFELSDIYFPNVLPDTLKTGLFGYINEIYTHGLKQNIYHTNVLYNEYFFNTASFPASIYNKAVDYDLVFSNSKPSRATIQLALKISELDNYKNTDDIYTIRRNKTKVLLGEFSFILPYDLIINIDYSSTDIPRVLAYYDVVNCQRINEDIESLYKNSYVVLSNISKIDNEYYLYVILDIFQLSVEENIQNINIVRLSDQIYFDVNYSDQLVNFYSEYYFPSNSNNLIVLDKFISDYNIGNSTEYCFFNYLDENSYRIYFTGDGFNPKSNSKIVTYTYSSKGSLGNFNYTGNIAIELEDNLTYIVNIYNKLYPSGGFDRSSLLDMKKELFKSIKKVNTLNTDDDLKEYFNYLCESTFNTNSIMKFIKIQDDILKREYGVYLTIFDDNNIPFSSNSVDITFNNKLDFTTAINNTIGLNDIIVYDSTNKKYRMLDISENYLDFKYRYTSPFLIKIREYGNNIYRLKYYNTYLDNNYSLYLKEKTTLTTDYYILNNIHIYRDSYYNNHIDFKCVLNTNVVLGHSDIHVRLNKIKIVAVLRDYNNKSIQGFFNLSYNETLSKLEDKYIYNSRLNGFNDIFVGELYNLNNVLHSPITGLLHDINIPEELILELIIIDNDPSIGEVFPSNNIVSSESTARQLENILFNNNDFFAASYVLDLNETKILFQSLNHIINSTVYQKDIISTQPPYEVIDTKYIFDRVPLLSLETFRLNDRKTLFSQQIINYSNKIFNSIENLCNSTSVNLKFFNTYGVSKLYMSDADDSSINNTVDLSLSFIIRLNVQYSDILENKIKDFILKYIRDNNSINNNELIKSNLVTAIENEFVEVKSAVFNKINESDSILSVKPKYSSDIINTVYMGIVPEYLYVGYDRNEDGSISTPKIEIIYK